MQLRVCMTLATFPLLVGAQMDPKALMEQARARIVSNLENLPKYTCVQTVNRVRFEPLVPVSGGRCRDVADSSTAHMLKAWSDQFKLDVTVADGAEIYSWAGAREFQSEDAQQIVGGGMMGSGDFGPFLMAVFGSSASDYQFLRSEQNVAVYQYHVPVSASHYRIKTGSRANESAVVGYEGTMWIDTRSGDLRRMTIVVPRPPRGAETCRVETTIDYQRFQIGDSQLPLPQSTVLELWDTDGMRYQNHIGYAGCRAFQSESVFRAETESPKSAAAAGARTTAAPAEVPAGVTLRIALTSKIDGGAFAGDAIEGKLLNAIKTRGGRVLAVEGAAVRGRIVHLEQAFAPSHYFLLGLKFLSLSVGGSDVPLALTFVPRSSDDRKLNGPAERRQGMAVWMIRDENLAIGPGFLSEWKTAEARDR